MSRKNKLGIFFIILGIIVLFIPVIDDYILYKKQEKDLNEINVALKKSFGETNKNKKSQSEVDVSSITDKAIAGLYIPSIDLKIPVFNGTKPNIIEKGVGLLEETGPLNAGKGHHAVLTSHSGLSISRLFTDLPKMKKDDKFYIKMANGEILAYKTFEIVQINPTEISHLKNIPDKDVVTLITCVPLFINTHRLLVKGERIPYNGENIDTKVPFIYQHIPYLLTVSSIVLVIYVIVVITNKAKNKNAKKKAENYLGNKISKKI